MFSGFGSCSVVIGDRIFLNKKLETTTGDTDFTFSFGVIKKFYNSACMKWVTVVKLKGVNFFGANWVIGLFWYVLAILES